MKIGRLSARMRKIRAEGEEAAEAGGELNLVPYLDIVTNVIMFMLATTVFAAAVADVRVAAAASCPAPPCEPAAGRTLAVSITARGFTVASSSGIEPMIPRRGGAYDYDALGERLAAIKREAPGERSIIVNANPDVPYEVVVGALDACRGPGDARFPDIALSTGAM